MSHSNRNYVLFTLRKGYYDSHFKWYPTWYTREELISRIARTTKSDGSNDILDNLSEDMSETECKFTYLKSNSRFLDGYYDYKYIYYIARVKGNAIIRINISSIINEINEKIIIVNKNYEAKRRKYAHERKLKNIYEFRKDPVPGIHNYNNCHRGTFYRYPTTTKSIRDSVYEDEEYKFIDTKAKKLPNVYDDIVRHNDKCWKTSYKCRKQWQKHLKKHMDTCE